MAKTILKWLVLILLMAYVTVITVWAHGEAARHSCQGIDIQIVDAPSTNAVTPASVRKDLDRFSKKIVGTPLEQVNTKKIEGFLQSQSSFEKVECSLLTDGRLSIAITPLVPEMRVFTPKGSYYVNKDGKQVESRANYFVDVPVVSGNFSQQFPAATLLPLVRHIQADETLRQLVGMIEARDRDNIILVPRIYGHVVNFGDTSDMAGKSRALLAFYRKVMPYKGWERYDTVSLRFKGQIVATRRLKQLPVHGSDDDDDTDMEEATLPQIEDPAATAQHTQP